MIQKLRLTQHIFLVMEQLHPRGIAFTNANVAKTEGPSRVELADPANWNPVYEPKQIRIVAFKHKLG